jgi:hypothetical protein
VANNGIPTNGNWRDLARQVQEENDPEKVIDLVQQLIAKFDEEKPRKNLPFTRKPEKPSGSPSL